VSTVGRARSHNNHRRHDLERRYAPIRLEFRQVVYSSLRSQKLMDRAGSEVFLQLEMVSKLERVRIS